MEVILNRYRNLTVLLAVIAVQLGLLGYQVKGNGEVRLIRVWAVGAVTPLARVIESARGGTAHFFRDYFMLLAVRGENQRLKTDLDRIKLENQYLRNELSTADRGRALALFQQKTQSKTIAAHVIGNTTGTSANVVIIDRGTSSGVQKGMAVITPDGIAGKITGAFPTASYVLLITDPSFAAGVLSAQNRVHGTIKGQRNGMLMVDYIQNEQKVDLGEWFYTSGDDRIFPKGLPVGQVVVMQPGEAGKEVFLAPSGLNSGVEEVLVVIEGVHASIPETTVPGQPVHMQEPPPASPEEEARPVQTGAPATDADRLVERYRKIGEIEKHEYGSHGGRAPNYNISVDSRAPEASSPVATPAANPPAPASPQSPASQKR